MSLLKVKNLNISYPTRKETIVASKDVEFTLERGEILGMVGEFIGNFLIAPFMILADTFAFVANLISGFIQILTLDFSGGFEKTDYFVSFNYLKEEGYIKRSDFQRFSVRANVNSQLKSWLKSGVNINFTKSGGLFASTDGSNSIVNPFFFASRTAGRL